MTSIQTIPKIEKQVPLFTDNFLEQQILFYLKTYKICPYCKKPRKMDNFLKRRRKCKICHNSYQRKYQQERKRKEREIEDQKNNNQ